MRMGDILFDLIHLPRRFNAGRMSMYELLRQTGYFEMHNQVSESGIRQTLVRHPECIDDWISYSEDKRTSSGSYIKQEDGTRYKVGCFSEKSGKAIDTSYIDRTDACAAFIKHEIEDIRCSPKNWN